MFKGFYKWFLGRGIKKFGIAILAILVLNLAFIFNYDTLWSDSISEIDKAFTLIGHLLILGFDLGILWLMRDNYRQSK